MLWTSTCPKPAVFIIDQTAPVITDDLRIQASVPTISELVARGARVIVMAHLGRPKGEVKPELSLRPIGQRLSQLLGKPVASAIGDAGRG